MRSNLLSALILALSFSSVAFAAHPLITDDAGTQGSGNYSLEVNGEMARRASNGERETSSEVAVVLSAGLGETVDLVLGVPFQFLRLKESGVSVEDPSGLADISLELKWRFFEQKGFCLAIKPGITLPAGDEDKGLGNGRASFGATFIATQELKPVILLLNLGYMRTEFDDDDGNRKDILSASLAVTTQVASGLQLVANVGAESNGESGNGTWPVFALAGVIWGVRESLDLDLGVKVGLNDQEADITALAGMVVRF
jgi:hypothetical protein